MSITRLVAVAGSAALAMSACGGVDGNPAETATVTVLAAASLTESFTRIAEAFESGNPGVQVVLGFGPSSGLVSQLVEGAPADVLATASTSVMKAAIDAGVVGAPTSFASNSLVIAVPAGNPAGITDLAGLAEPGVLVAVCAPQVPCGAAAERVIETSGLPIEPVTFDSDVKAVLNKVVLDEVDAGMVYATDVIAAGESVVGVTLPEDLATNVTYPIAPTLNSSAPNLAQAFIDFVLAAQAQQILAAAGFGPPAR